MHIKYKDRAVREANLRHKEPKINKQAGSVSRNQQPLQSWNPSGAHNILRTLSGAPHNNNKYGTRCFATNSICLIWRVSSSINEDLLAT